LPQDHGIASKSVFRNIFIVESQDVWSTLQKDFDPVQDAVLTYDLALRKQIEKAGGAVAYIDHLCEQSFMQENNFLMYRFFRDWHLDTNKADIFRENDVDFGFSFRIEIWNDFTFYVRCRLCLERLREFAYQRIYLESGLPLVREILEDMGLAFELLERRVSKDSTSSGYFFPINRWMDERLRIRRPRHVVRDLIVTVQGIAMSWLDRIVNRFAGRVGVFVQEYHPTRVLLQRLRQHPGIRVLQAHFSAAPGMMKFLRERPMPVYGNLKKYHAKAARLVEEFQRRRSALLILSNGVDITDAVNRIIEKRVAEVLPKSLRALDCVIRYLDRHPIRLEILIGNIGQLATLIDCVAKSRGIPSYMIINGLMSGEYLDESKYATVINAYSPSIRDNYFRGMDNIVCLGDPRMDAYSQVTPKNINRISPTITVGTSGFNNVDLNSFVAVEFEFLDEVLSAIRNLTDRDRRFRVVLKVRPNGYRELYQQFTDEYFPGMVDVIIDEVPMRTVLDGTDLFISIYSQALFEASCMGIPVIYHKNDREIIDPPFDGKSELVTSHDIADLEQALRDFLSGSHRFDAFLDRNVMEKYVGPLDGGNLKRNIDFVFQLLDKQKEALAT
jgi:hypothetical protein